MPFANSWCEVVIAVGIVLLLVVMVMIAYRVRTDSPKRIEAVVSELKGIRTVLERSNPSLGGNRPADTRVPPKA